MSEVYGIEIDGRPVEWGLTVDSNSLNEKCITLKYRCGTRSTVIDDMAVVETAISLIEHTVHREVDVKLVAWSRNT